MVFNFFKKTSSQYKNRKQHLCPDMVQKSRHFLLVHTAENKDTYHNLLWPTTHTHTHKLTNLQSIHTYACTHSH